MNSNVYCAVFKKLKKTHQDTNLLEKKQNERTHDNFPDRFKWYKIVKD